MDRRTAGILIILGLIVLLAAGIHELVRTGSGLFDDWLIRILILFAALGAAVGVIGVLRAHPHRGHAVLWCRRFGDEHGIEGQRSVWSRSILIDAARGLVLPVTLRDRSVQEDRSIEQGLDAPLGLLIGFIGLPGFMWVAVSLPDDFLDTTWGILTVLALFILVWAGIIWLHGWLTTSFATYRGTPEELRSTVGRAIRRRGTRAETFVVRCTATDWRACVEALLDEMSFVVLDMTAANENVEWEVRRSLATKGPERVLFIEEVADGSEPLLAQGPSPIEGEANATPTCTLLRYGGGRIEDERQAFLIAAENESGGVHKPGPRTDEITRELRKWLEVAVHKHTATS